MYISGRLCVFYAQVIEKVRHDMNWAKLKKTKILQLTLPLNALFKTRKLAEDENQKTKKKTYWPKLPTNVKRRANLTGNSKIKTHKYKYTYR